MGGMTEERLCEGCSALADRSVTQADCEAGLRRVSGLDLPHIAATSLPPLRARLWLPYDRPPKSLVGNSRAHWRQRSADTQQVRGDVMRLAQNAGLHRLGPLKHITAELVWAPGDRRRRDADNLWPLLKVAC